MVNKVLFASLHYNVPGKNKQTKKNNFYKGKPWFLSSNVSNRNSCFHLTDMSNLPLDKNGGFQGKRNKLLP